MNAEKPIDAEKIEMNEMSMPSSSEYSASGNDAVIEEAITCLKALASGDFTRVPQGHDPLSTAVREMAQSRIESVRAALRAIVDDSIQANETAISYGETVAATQDADQRTHAIAAAIEELSASVNEISAASESANELAQQVSESASEGRQATDKATRTMEEISTIVGNTATQVNTLAEASKHIEDIVSTISDIAGQTNLLALNATIEAARAGEAGKGFAVVASEVKNLSQQTARATVDIRERIERLREETSNIVSSMSQGTEAVQAGSEAMQTVHLAMENVNTNAENVRGRMQEINDILTQQNQATQEVAHNISELTSLSKTVVRQVEKTADSVDGIISRIGDKMQRFANFNLPGKVIHLAKADHVIWKKRLANMFVGRESLRADELADHNSCRLGKWYYSSDLAERYRNHPAYKKLEEPHKLVHKHGIEAARRHNNGDIKGALEEIQKMEKASEDVLRLLSELETADQ